MQAAAEYEPFRVKCTHPRSKMCISDSVASLFWHCLNVRMPKISVHEKESCPPFWASGTCRHAPWWQLVHTVARGFPVLYVYREILPNCVTICVREAA